MIWLWCDKVLYALGKLTGGIQFVTVHESRTLKS